MHGSVMDIWIFGSRPEGLVVAVNALVGIG